jgi:hypothetical protein
MPVGSKMSRAGVKRGMGAGLLACALAACSGQKLVNLEPTGGVQIAADSVGDVPAGTAGNFATSTGTGTTGGGTSSGQSATTGGAASTTTGGVCSGLNLSQANDWTMTSQYNLQQAGLPTLNTVFTDLNTALTTINDLGIVTVPSWILQTFSILASFDSFFSQLNVTSTVLLTETDAGVRMVEVDAGARPDAGEPDAGEHPDGGALDAGEHSDGGEADGGTRSDGGAADAGTYVAEPYIIYIAKETWTNVISTNSSGTMIDLTAGQVTVSEVNPYLVSMTCPNVAFATHSIGGNLAGLVTPLLDGVVDITSGGQYGTLQDLLTYVFGSICNNFTGADLILCDSLLSTSLQQEIYTAISNISFDLSTASVTGTAVVATPTFLDGGVWTGTDSAGTFDGNFTCSGQ